MSLQSTGRRPSPLLQEIADDRPFTWRSIMKKLIAALALVTLIAVPTFTQSANAADVSPASSSFGENGY